MNAHPEINHVATEDRIRAIAYSLWEEEGHPEGCAEQHWFRAMKLLAAEAEPGAPIEEHTRQDETAKLAEMPAPSAAEQTIEKSTKGNESKRAA